MNFGNDVAEIVRKNKREKIEMMWQGEEREKPFRQ